MGNLTVLSACVGCSASTADAAVCLPHRIRHGGRDDVESGGLGTMEERSIFEWFEGKVVAGTSWVLWASHSPSGEGPTSLLRRSDDEPGVATIFFDEQRPRRHGRIPSSSAMSHPGHETNCGDSCGLTFRQGLDGSAPSAWLGRFRPAFSFLQPRIRPRPRPGPTRPCLAGARSRTPVMAALRLSRISFRRPFASVATFQTWVVTSPEILLNSRSRIPAKYQSNPAPP